MYNGRTLVHERTLNKQLLVVFGKKYSQSSKIMAVEDNDSQVVLTHPSNPETSVTILKYGANVISWKNKGTELLWLSEGAKLDGSKPVRGGIPLVFPVFGKQKNESHPTFPLPQHGFARNSTWEFLGQTTANPPTVQFALSPEQVSSESLQLWGKGKYDFTLILTISLEEEKLTTSIEVENPGAEEFEFNWLFHTYFRVPDITDTLVNNLIDQKCFDQLLAEEYVEKSPVVSFHEEFDRVYKKVDTSKIFQIIEFGKVLVNVERVNLPDAVVWNPWIKKSDGMADFLPKTGYLNMVCVEPGHVSDFVTLKKGEKWSGSQVLTVGGEIKVQTNIY
ncbi:galactose mutarotase-like domain-containing protein [Scheffersomyces xylosifermentans]|uniref:galactose mutarotase-like domain-containing protein n=1 Tax=Scheffersomyces xylosifermentans TaxID=1304137 RepID=UPI00315CDD7E